MTKESFRKLLAPIKQDLSNGSVRVDKAVKMFKNAKGKEREKFFNAILEYTRFDIAEAFIDRKIFTEEELYNLALQVKLYDLRIAAAEHVHYKLTKPEVLATKAILALELSDSKEFYSDLVDLLKQEKELGFLEPNKKNLENLYLELLREGNKDALKELHAYLGYKTGKDVIHNEDLATALKSGDFNKFMELVSQGYLITDFKFVKEIARDNRIKIWKFLSGPNFSSHPNIGLLQPLGGLILPDLMSYNMLPEFKAALETPEGRAALAIKNNFGGFTPLHEAVISEDIPALKVMLETAEGKAALAIENNYGYGGFTPLHLAVSKCIDVLKVMLETAEGRAALAIKDKHGNTPIHIAGISKYIPALRVMLETAEGKAALAIENNLGCTPLNLASISADAEVVKVLLEYGAIPEFVDIVHAMKLPPELNAQIKTLYKEAWKSSVYNCWSAIKAASIMYSGDISKAYEQEDEKTHTQKQNKNKNSTENRGRE